MNRQAQSTGRLNTLLRGELAAVLAYQHAVRSLDGAPGGELAHIRGFGDAHQRAVAALQGCIRTLGGIASAEAGTWGAFTLLRDAPSVRQLLGAEETGLAEYLAALPTLAGEVRDLVEQELIPRQREHVATLSRILLGIEGAPP